MYTTSMGLASFVTALQISRAKRRPASNIDAPYAQELWDEYFHDSAEVKWSLFEGGIRRHLTTKHSAEPNLADTLDLVKCALCGTGDDVTVYRFSEVFSPSLGTDLPSSLKVLSSRSSAAELLVHIVIRLRPSLELDVDADPGFVLVRATDSLAALRSAIRDAHADDDEEGISFLAKDRFQFLLKEGKVRVRRKDEAALTGADTLTDASVVEEKSKPKPAQEPPQTGELSEGGGESGSAGASAPSLPPLAIIQDEIPDEDFVEVLPTPRDLPPPNTDTLTTPAGAVRTAAFLKTVLRNIPDDVPIGDLQAILAAALSGQPVHTKKLSAAAANAIADRALASALAARASALSVEDVLADDKLWLDLRAISSNMVDEEDIALVRESVLVKKELKATLQAAVLSAQLRVSRIANTVPEAPDIGELCDYAIRIASPSDDALKTKIDGILER